MPRFRPASPANAGANAGLHSANNVIPRASGAPCRMVPGSRGYLIIRHPRVGGEAIRPASLARRASGIQKRKQTKHFLFSVWIPIFMGMTSGARDDKKDVCRMIKQSPPLLPELRGGWVGMTEVITRWLTAGWWCSQSLRQ